MKQMYRIVHIILLFALGLSACAPGTSGSNPTQSPAEAQEGIPTQAVHPAPKDEPPQQTVANSNTQPPSILFIENTGQFDPEARFQARTNLGIAYLAKNEIWLTLLVEDSSQSEETANSTDLSNLSGQQALATPTPEEDAPVTGVNIRLTFVDSNPDAKVEGFNPQTTKVSYFNGNDEGEWKIDVPVWGGIRYVDFYPGYDLEITSEGAQWTWRLVPKETISFKPSGFFETISHLMQSGSENSEIRLRIDGAESLELIDNDLIINTAVGDINLPLPMPETGSTSSYSSPETTTTPELPELDGNEVILPLDTTDNTQPTSHESSSLSKVRLALMDISRTVKQFSPIRPYKAPLTDLPAPSGDEIVFSTFIGGSLNDTIYDVVMDESGMTYITGTTTSLDYPVTPGTISMPGAEQDVVVSKLGPDGDQLEWSAQIGGNGTDIGAAIALDDSNNVYITGRTLSTDLPVTLGAFDTDNTDSEAFVIKLNPSGTELVYSTYLGAGATQGFDILVANGGEAYVTGQTASETFPVTAGAFDETFNGDWDGFVSHLNAEGSNLIFSTYLGGSSADCEIGGDLYECSIALDSSGAIYVGGQTLSEDFPTTSGAYDRIHNGDYDLFVVKMQPDGSSLVYSTFIGGTDNDSCESECSIVVDADGNVYLSGATLSTNFPTTSGAYDRTQNGDWDAVILKISADGGNLEFSTYLGGVDKDNGRSVTLVNDRVAVTGETTSSNFPVTIGAYQGAYGGGLRDAFITIFDVNGRAVDYSTFLGGSVNERGLGIFSKNGILVVSGNTTSSDFPITPGVYDQTFGGLVEGFVYKFVPEAVVEKPVIEEKSVVSSASAGDECNDCIGCSVNSTQGTPAGPINTRTGGYDYTMTDLYFMTTAGELSFVRTYSSLALDLPTNLSPGWTQNQDMRLIFPADPGGQEGAVLLKSKSANQYSFYEQTDGTFQAAPGIRAMLARNSGTPVTYAVVDVAQNVYTFDEDGKLLTFENSQGRGWDYSYNTNGDLDHVSANNGLSYLAFEYDSQYRIIAVKDHTDRSVSYEYDSAGDLVSVVDVLDQTWSFTYDNSHRITQVTAPDLTVVERTEYDSLGRAVRQYDGEGHLVVELTYNSDGTTTVTDALGNEQVHTYDSRNTLVGETNAVNLETTTVYGNDFQPLWVTNAAGHTLSMTWSEDGVDLLSKTDPAGNTTSNTYDSLHNLVSTTDPLGNTTTHAYDGKLLLSTTDALNGTTTYTYTPEGYLASVTDSAGRTTSYTYNPFGLRDSMTDPNGNTWSYEYDELGRLTDTTDPQGRVSHTEYNDEGQIVRSVRNYQPSYDKNYLGVYNIETVYEYNARGKQISVTDTYEHTTQYVYDNADRLIQTIDAAGNSTQNEYDAAGQLVATIDALGNRTTYTYDPAGRLLYTTNALGYSSGATTFDAATNTSTVTDLASHETTFFYDELGRVFMVRDALGNTTLTAYDENGNVKTRTDQLGRETQYFYDELNRLIRTIDANGGVTQTIYNEKGQRIATIDALGKQTTYTYDDQGRLVATTDPLGRTTRTEYDQYGRRIASIDAADKRTEYTYDLLDRVTEVRDAVGNVTTTSFDALGNVLSRTDGNGHTTTYTHDDLYRTLTTTDPNGFTTTNTYDAAGNLLSVSNAIGETTSYFYDALNRRVAVVDPLGHSRQTFFNPLGQVSSVMDENEVVTYFEYDALGRQTALVLNFKPIVDPDAETNVRYDYTYNAVGNRETVTDPNGNITRYTYDPLNHVLSKVDPLDNTWHYEYDAAGNQVTVTDAKSQVTYYAYDDAGQLTTIDYPDSDVNFTYTDTGQRATMVDGLGTTTWIYDDLNRLISVTDPFDQTVGYGYDAVGNRTSLTYPDGHVVQYTFDAGNRLTNVNDPEIEVGYNYDAGNHMRGITRTNGVESLYTYDAAGRVTNLTHLSSQDTLASYDYAYDPAGNLIQAIENVVQPVPPTPTPTLPPTETLTETPTETLTETPTETITPTITETGTPTSTPTETLTPTSTPVFTGTDLYLHGEGSSANPPTLFLNTSASTGSTAKYKDSASINFNGGNPWTEVGTWDASPAGVGGQLSSLNDLHVWLGLKNSDDQGTNFDLRAEVYKNGELVASDETLCITDITRNANKAKEAAVSFAPFEPVTLDGGTDSLSIKILTRIGTDGSGNRCGGHSNAVGLRLYFDSTSRPSRFGLVTSFAAINPPVVKDPGIGFSLVSFARPQGLQFASDGLVYPLSLQSGSPLTINYTYDSLRRLKIADYSDGRNFAYTYDPNGNTLEATQNLGDGPVTTSYTYDAASQLVTAEADTPAWHYVYDENGSLVEVLPGGEEASGAKRYTYNAAGYLTQVESHDGSGWNVQSEMSYNGLGVRMTSSALGLTTRYTSDGQLPLTISSDERFATVLYGLGPTAEKTDEWNYVLNDGTGVPRQLTDMAGEVTMFVRYSPWGKPIETEGIGNFDASFIGTLIDATTGLIYIGNGQYYDPETGRFLTRRVNPNSTNPYVPWNPIGILLGPLGMISANKARKKMKYTPAWTIAFLSLFMVACWALVAIAVGGLLLTSCSAGSPAQETESPASTTQPAGPATVPAETPASEPAPNQTPTQTDPCANCTATPTSPRFEKIIFICGRDGGTACATGNAPLYPFREWAERNGYQNSDFKIHDIDSCNSADGKQKLNCANMAINDVNTESSARFLLIGHSAGADSVIIAGDRISDKGRIAGITLLDPSMDATLENDDLQNQESTNLQTMADNLPPPKFLGDTTGPPGDEIYVTISGASEIEYPLSHAELALNDSVVTDMVNAFGWSEMLK
jgi:YD repeat-containing protein